MAELTSTDDTTAVVARYCGQEPGIEFFRGNENKGVIAMLNRGLALADTEYVSFLAADDFVKPGLYAKSLDILNRYPNAAICGVRTLLIGEDGSPLHSSPEPGLGLVTR